MTVLHEEKETDRSRMEAAQPNAVPRAPGFRRMFAEHRLTLGVFFAIESYPGDIPRMLDQISLAKRAEEAGVAALWVRDVPLRDPSFGDVGQIYDPWVWMGYVLGQTESIALATGAIVLPLRHPLHVAKAAASIDNLSGGRLVLGLASGDRPIEFPAFRLDVNARGDCFRESLLILGSVLGHSIPRIVSSLGVLEGAELLPKPLHGRIPIAITGSSQQSLDWIAAHADAWITYPRPLRSQHLVSQQWREAVGQAAGNGFKPFAQSLYIDLLEDPHAPATPMHLGYRLGRVALVEHLEALRSIGVNHVALNLKYGSRPAVDVIDELGSEIIPHFPAHADQKELRQAS
jgi:luciferase-type oxidoreductase